MVDKRSSSQKITRLLLLVTLSIATYGCASVDVPRIGDQEYTVYDDERRMQKRADEICKKIDESRFLYNDVRLEQYLTSVAENLLKTQGSNEAIIISTKTLRDPNVNAISFCNGRIYVFTGLLAAMDNESQLATVIAHEISHILKRDTLREFRSRINKSAFYSSLAAGFVVSSGELIAVSSIAGYSRQLENEADIESFKMVESAGYDIKESIKAFERMNEFANLEQSQKQGRASLHPDTNLRIENFKRLTQENKTSPTLSLTRTDATYKNITLQPSLEDIDICIDSHMYKTANKVIEKLIQDNPKKAEVYFYLGELNRKRQDLDSTEQDRDKNKDYAKSIEAYNRALMYNPRYASALKEKGLLLNKQGNKTEAKHVLRCYLDVNPYAEDRSYIENILNNN